MEVLAILSSIPPLVELLKGTVDLIQACASDSSIVKATTGLDSQISLLVEVVGSIDSRWKTRNIPTERLVPLGTVLKELQVETKSLNGLLLQAKYSKGPFRRAKLAATGFEKKIKLHVQRLENVKTLLILKLTDSIEATLSEGSQATHASRLLQIKDVLQPSTFDFIPAKQAGTFDWLSSHPTFCNLTADDIPEPKDRVLCVYGVKGCGKSVLAASIASDLRARNAPIGFFSFWSQSKSQTKLTQWLATVIWQLLKQLPQQGFERVTEYLMQELPLGVQSLAQGLHMILEQVTEVVWLVVDGIDESEDEWSTINQGGLKIIQDLLSTHRNARILLLGRESSLYEALKHSSAIEMTQQLLREDINQLITAELALLSNVPSQQLRNAVQATLESKATVMFLWVKLVFRELRQCFSSSEVKATLEDLPADLDEEYRRLFVALAKRLGYTSSTEEPPVRVRRAKTLLSLIIGAVEPLTLDELRHAHALTCHPDKGWEDYLITDDGIVDACGDFVQITQGKVHLGHSSVREFLTRSAQLQQPDTALELFRIDPVRKGELLTLACLDYLRVVDWGYPLHDDSSKQLSQDFPLLMYAHQYAMYHLLQFPEPTVEIVSRLRQFMESRGFCKWVEYALLQFFHDFTSLESWAGVVEFVSWYNDKCQQGEVLLQLIERRVCEELSYRTSEYGVLDPRTESWQCIESFVNSRSEFKTDTPPETAAAEPAATLPLRLSYMEPGLKHHHLGNAQRAVMHRVDILTTASPRSTLKHTALLLRQASMPLLSANLRFDPLRILFTIASAKLPIPMVLVSGLHFELHGMNEEAFVICSIATERLEGQNSLEEAMTKMLEALVLAERNGDSRMATVATLDRTREALEIFQSLPQNLCNEFFRYWALLLLVSALFDLDQTNEAFTACRQLTPLLTDPHFAMQDESIWARYIRRSGLWAQFQSYMLRALIDECMNARELDEALTISTQAALYLQQFHGPARQSSVDLDIQRATILIHLRRFPEATAALKKWFPPQYYRQQDTVEIERKWGDRLSIQGDHEDQPVSGEWIKQCPGSSDDGWHVITNIARLFYRRGDMKNARKEISKLDFFAAVPDLTSERFGRAFQVFSDLHWRRKETYTDKDNKHPSFRVWLSKGLDRCGIHRQTQGPSLARRLKWMAELFLHFGHPFETSMVLNQIYRRKLFVEDDD